MGQSFSDDPEIAESDVRYAQEVEEYVFRIVQQAYENACQHAAARTFASSARRTSVAAAYIVQTFLKQQRLLRNRNKA